MSRCFPFPPPGYEKKSITEDPDLLKKEKRREKKHKKDKKDKEKKDGKEKREKDRSEGKHKEKKDKKDKHRDKKKDKEKVKTSTPSDEKKGHGQFEGHNGERLHHNNEQSREKSNSTDDKKSFIQFPHQNGDLVRNKIKVGGDTENLKFIQELDRRIRDEEKGTGSQQFVVEGRKSSVEIQKPDGRQAVVDMAVFGGGVAVPNSRLNGATMPPPLDNKRIEKMQSDDKRGDKRKNKDRDKHKDKEKEKSKEKSEQKKAERDRNKHITKQSDSVAIISPNNFSTHPLENSFQGVGNEGNLKKRKDMEMNGVSYENELRPNKMARPISIISPENGRKLDFLQNPPGSSLSDSKQGASMNSLKVGSKDGQRVNGMITSQPGSVPAKKPPTAINQVPCKPFPIKSPHVTSNHVAAQSPPVPAPKLQPNHIVTQPPTLKPQPITPKPLASIPNPIASHQLPPLSSTPPPPTTTAKQPVSRPKPPPAAAAAVVTKVVAQPPPPLPVPKKKPPHPDTKYLNQILSVPKLDQWVGCDDQEWLFSSKARPTSKKPMVEDLEVQVWSEAKHIESVDVCALPYVIPY